MAPLSLERIRRDALKAAKGYFYRKKAKVNGMENDQLIAEIERLKLENERLKQEIAKLRGLKRPTAGSMESMSTKLKEALRE